VFQELSLRAKIGQMIVVRTTGYLFDHQIRYPAWEATNHQLTYWLKELNIGGVILLGGSAAEISLRTQQLQELAPIPLLICADVEEGVGQRFAGATWFPPPMALSTIAETNLDLACEYAFRMGEITAAESLAIGINWILAPLVDVNNNPNNPVINLRSFGDRPEIVSQLATSFIKGAQSYPILTTAKHFPGHGDTSTDSHLELPVIKHSQERLEQIELPPFQAAIQADVDSVMTAHLLVEAYDKDNPATLSHPILTGLLRNQLGFEGLIVTDALIMGGVAKFATSSEIAVKAILAGADILLMPSDPEEVINSVEKAVNTGILSTERIDYSLARIAKAKQKIQGKSEVRSQKSEVNSYHNPLAQTISKIQNKVGKPEYFAQVDSILELTTQQGGDLSCISRKDAKLVLNDSEVTQRDFSLGSLISPQDRNLILVDDLLSCDFLERLSPCVTIPQQFGYEKQLLDFSNFYLATFDHRPTLLQVFVRGNPFRGSSGLSEQSKQIYQRLISSGIVQALVVYGSPYVKDWLLSILPPSTPWVFSFAQHSPAQRIACQRLFSLSRFDNVTDGNFI
jgi:beta-glucosidase